MEDPKTDTKLTAERAASIGWFFIESYYELYNQNPENLYKLYNSTAAVAHADVPEASTTVRQAHGTDAIKALFKDIKEDGKKNKIIITGADIQMCLTTNILIVVSGEWSKNGSPYYQFGQTFVLCPGINDSTFDIANDVLKYNGYEFKAREATRSPEPVPEPEVAEEKAEPEVATPEVAEPKEEATPEAKVPEPEDKEEAAAPVGSLSWAALAATASEKSPVAKQAAPASAAVAAASAAVAVKAKKTTQAPTLPNGKYKKEDWFPIYIRGCEDLDEKLLKEQLIKEFGEIKFFKQNSNIALCDFVDGDGQRKALDAKKITVDGITVSLEVRESKNGKKDKDFKFKDKPNDPKRRNDKKQAAKKNKP